MTSPRPPERAAPRSRERCRAGFAGDSSPAPQIRTFSPLPYRSRPTQLGSHLIGVRSCIATFHPIGVRSCVATFGPSAEPGCGGQMAWNNNRSYVIHRAWFLLARQRTMPINALRGRMAEFGIARHQSIFKAFARPYAKPTCGNARPDPMLSSTRPFAQPSAAARASPGTRPRPPIGDPGLLAHALSKPPWSPLLYVFLTTTGCGNARPDPLPHAPP